jgi:hypothetical protein
VKIAVLLEENHAMEFRKFDPYASYTPWKKWCLIVSLSVVGYMAARHVMALFGIPLQPWHLHLPGLSAMITVSYLATMQPQWPLVGRVAIGWTLALAIGFTIGYLAKILRAIL